MLVFNLYDQYKVLRNIMTFFYDNPDFSQESFSTERTGSANDIDS